MSANRFEISASKATRDDFHGAINRGLRSSWGAHVMRWTWKGGTCHCSAPGATGSLRLENGRIIAVIRLSVLALPLRARIHDDIVTVLKRLGDGHVSVGPATRHDP
jgi:hypothetical protein